MTYSWDDILYHVEIMKIECPSIFKDIAERTIDITDLPARFSNITSIDGCAFCNCTNLALTSLPNSITTIGGSAFSDCKNLALTSLPESLTKIGFNAFYRCTSLAITSLPAGITKIDSGAFSGCTNLTSITFKGTPTTINSTAFDGCTNLTVVNVPWAEGAIAGAPWGATKATINYNYTGE